MCGTVSIGSEHGATRATASNGASLHEDSYSGRIQVPSAAARFPTRSATTMIDDLDKTLDLLERAIQSLRSA
jgi:hypothetical protein